MLDFTVEVAFSGKIPKHPDLVFVVDQKSEITPARKLSDEHPYIIGMGPAGLFCALAMVEKGLKPIIFDQGDDLDKRDLAVREFWDRGVLDEKSNVQFGEGGAGTFSDGKLTCRSRDRFISRVYEYLVHFGANPVIKYEALPHLGTDGIRQIVRALREYLVKCGCEFHFRAELNGIAFSAGKKIKLNIGGEDHYPEVVVLALGNASSATALQLHKAGVSIEPKPFAVGFRIEHEQAFIDEAVYGSKRWAQELGAASYRLTDRDTGTYSFCMCPGGEIIAASSERHTVVTNGMSYSGRHGRFGNSAIVTAIGAQDYGSGIFAGVKYQQALERASYRESYFAPVQSVRDFINGCTRDVSRLVSYKPATIYEDLNALLSQRQTLAIKKALQKFDGLFRGFIVEGMLVGTETRTSFPLRITRNLDTNSVLDFPDLYCVGEGSGYAGGIISSAADGLKIGSIFT